MHLHSSLRKEKDSRNLQLRSETWKANRITWPWSNINFNKVKKLYEYTYTDVQKIT